MHVRLFISFPQTSSPVNMSHKPSKEFTRADRLPLFQLLDNVKGRAAVACVHRRRILEEFYYKRGCSARERDTRRSHANAHRCVRVWGLGACIDSSGLYCHFPSIVFNRFSLLSCLISRSMRIEVMPHSATSRERGEAISTTMAWNSGVAVSHLSMRLLVV